MSTNKLVQTQTFPSALIAIFYHFWNLIELVIPLFLNVFICSLLYLQNTSLRGEKCHSYRFTQTTLLFSSKPIDMLMRIAYFFPNALLPIKTNCCSINTSRHKWLHRALVSEIISSARPSISQADVKLDILPKWSPILFIYQVISPRIISTPKQSVPEAEKQFLPKNRSYCFISNWPWNSFSQRRTRWLQGAGARRISCMHVYHNMPNVLSEAHKARVPSWHHKAFWTSSRVPHGCSHATTSMSYLAVQST